MVRTLASAITSCDNSRATKYIRQRDPGMAGQRHKTAISFIYFLIDYYHTQEGLSYGISISCSQTPVGLIALHSYVHYCTHVVKKSEVCACTL